MGAIDTMARRHTKTLTLTAKTTDHVDVLAYADWLAQVFGSPSRALVHAIRHTRLYHRWRQLVEWCPHCRRYIPVRRRTNATATLHIHRLADRPGLECPGSGKEAVRTDTVPPELVAAEKAALDMLVERSTTIDDPRI